MGATDHRGRTAQTWAQVNGHGDTEQYLAKLAQRVANARDKAESLGSSCLASSPRKRVGRASTSPARFCNAPSSRPSSASSATHAQNLCMAPYQTPLGLSFSPNQLGSEEYELDAV